MEKTAPASRRGSKQVDKTIYEKTFDKINKGLCVLDTWVPWFDLFVFLKYFLSALCIHLIADSSFIVLACVAFYRIVIDLEIPIKPAKGVKGKTQEGDNGDRQSVLPPFPQNPSFRITFGMVSEIGVRFLMDYSAMIFISLISYIGFSLLTFVLACYVSVLDSHRSLTERIRLEEITDDKLRKLLRETGIGIPKWLSKPDSERVEWLNKMLEHLWPYLSDYVEDMVEDAIEKQRPAFNFQITDLTSGSKSPRISSVNIRRQGQEMFLDVSVVYDGDFTCCVKWMSGVEFEIDHLQIKADLQIELKNFVSYEPFVGAIVVHMDKAPAITPRLRKMASAIESFKPIKKRFEESIQNALKNQFPLHHVLVKDPVENLIDPQISSKSQSEKKNPFAKKKTGNIWEAAKDKVTHEEVIPHQIVTYLHDHKTPRKRFSDPIILGNKREMEIRDTYSTQPKNWQNKSRPPSSTSIVTNLPVSDPISSTYEPQLIKSQIIPSIAVSDPFPSRNDSSAITSSSESSRSLSIPSFMGLSVETLHSKDVLDQSFNTKSPDRTPSLREASKQQEQEREILISDFGSRQKYQKEDGGDLKLAPTARGPSLSSVLASATRGPSPSSSSSSSSAVDQETVLELTRSSSSASASGKWEGGLRSAIARDVEQSQVAFQDKVSSESATDNDSIKSEEVLEPITLVSRKGLAGMLDASQGHGCIELTTTYKAPNILVVTVHSVRNLPKKGGRTPNPYVKLHLQNQHLKHVTDMSTDILENTHNPDFNKTFEFELNQRLSEYTLRVSTKTKHKLAHSLGQVVLCFAPSHSSQAVSERNWYDLADPKKDHVMCWVGYRDVSHEQTVKTDSINRHSFVIGSDENLI